jgi:radical SAM superfamily enzyme YgiQ (UPF0313 family)
MYTKVFLRLEPLGLELVGAAARQAGHDLRLLDLQVESHAAYFRTLKRFRPDAIGFSCNYLANVPEILDLARETKRRRPETFVFVGGHSASFIAEEFLEHGRGAVDAVLRGEGEAGVGPLLDAIPTGPGAVSRVPGVVTAAGAGPPPAPVRSLDDLRPARSMLRHRRKYFLGFLDPCASIEFTRGCPWDCSFCSAWTFYGRGYRRSTPSGLSRISRASGSRASSSSTTWPSSRPSTATASARRSRERESARSTTWRRAATCSCATSRSSVSGSAWPPVHVPGLEAIDEEGLRKYRKRVSLGKNFEALECARSLGLRVAINLIADPDWDRDRFEVVRQWCRETPEIVNISVNTPYPGTETWHTESRRVQTRDYRLYDIQHAVLPTRLPLAEFYEELIKTQQVLNGKHMGWAVLGSTARLALERLARGQTNFVRMLWKFNSVYDPALLLADHSREVEYAMRLPPPAQETVEPERLFVLPRSPRANQSIDEATERFVQETRTPA